MMLDRLGLVTWAASLVLELPYAASVYVTAENKNLQRIAAHLGISPEQCYLFDDKAKEHAAYLKDPDQTGSAKNIIEVTKYNFQTMDPELKAKLISLLQAHFPRQTLSKTNPKLFKEASKPAPGWPSHSLVIDENTGLWITGRDVEPQPYHEWPVNPLLQRETKSEPKNFRSITY